jgi:hypothetical protein
LPYIKVINKEVKIVKLQIMTVLRIINLAAFLVMILMNYLANSLPINNKTTGELSGQYPNLFVPAGVTFSIWGVIYLLLLGFVVLQFRDRDKVFVEAIGWLFALSCLMNALWIVFWHYEFPGISLIIMLMLLLSLIVINYRLTSLSSGIIKAGFGLYLGWICIATIANATAFLVAFNWQGWGLTDQAWATVMVLAGTVITFLVLDAFRNPFTGLAVIWALTGIIIARWPVYLSIIIAAGLSIIAVAVVSALIITSRYRV